MDRLSEAMMLCPAQLSAVVIGNVMRFSATLASSILTAFIRRSVAVVSIYDISKRGP
jgi:hypothetical protein